MIDSINRNAFELVNLITCTPHIVSTQPSELKGSEKELGFDDWSDKVSGIGIGRTLDDFGNTIDMSVYDEIGLLSFSKTDFEKFKKLTCQIGEIPSVSNTASISFIESEVFKWMVDVYKTNRAERTLLEHLLSVLEKETQSITFHFPILNLAIEKPFKIGKTEFIFFTKAYFDELYDSLQEKQPDLTEEIFDKTFRNDFQGKVLAKVTVVAEGIKAEEIAKSIAEIAVDVLKLYSESAVVPSRKTLFDLSFRLGYQVQSKFLTQRPNTEGVGINFAFRNNPFKFHDMLYQSAHQSGLNLFSDYLLKKKTTELDKIVLQSIHLFASSISNADLHLRCVNLITIIESILLKDEEESDLERRVKARLSKALSNDHSQKEQIKMVMSHIYQVRHKMIHKAKRIAINQKDLSRAQMMLTHLLLRLIHFSTDLGFTNKTILIENLNQIKS